MDLIDEVKDYFRRAKRRGVSAALIVEKLKHDGVKIESAIDTINKFVRIDERKFDNHNDLMAFRRFFTETPFGQDIIGGLANVPSDRVGSAAPSNSRDAVRPPVAPRPFGKPIEPGVPDQESETLTDLGTIRIKGEQGGPGTMGIRIEVYCNVSDGMALKRIRIDLDPRPGVMMQASRDRWNKPKRQPTTMQERLGTVLLRCWNSGLNPFWIVNGQDQPIGNFAISNFAELENLSPGDRVKATLSARLRDLNSSGSASARTAQIDDLMEVEDDGTPKQTPQSESGKARQKVMDFFREDALGADTRGHIRLASHVLLIVEAKDDRRS